MKSSLNIFLSALFIAHIGTSLWSADELKPKPEDHVLTLCPADEKEWGAAANDIRKVLYSTSDTLWKYFPERQLPPILIAPKGGPITLYQRGPNGEVQVKLATGKTYWAQYAFQFAHEFCHVLCECKPHENPNHWFEESLCETASLFALRRMSEVWKDHPPYPNWKSYSASLNSYADERIEKAKLPPGQTFLEWFKENETVLRKNSTDRPRNCIIANELLPLFEKEPAMWEAVSYLNVEKMTKLHTFKQYLEAWRRSSPEKHRAFIDGIAKRFAIEP